MSTRAADVFKVAPGLSPARRRKILSYLAISDEECPLTNGAALFIWVAHLLHRRSHLDIDVQDLILTTFKQTIVNYGNKLAAALQYEKKVIPVAWLAIVDEHYVAMTGFAETLDLREGKLIEGTEKMGLETTAWALSILYSNRMAKLQ